jgi:predicted RNA methylase
LETSVLDPCAGTGAALAAIAAGTGIRRYAVELDAYRAAEARAYAHEVVQGSAFDCHAPVESFSVLYLNPPYDFEVGEGKNQRMEQRFLEHCYRWLKPSGVLMLIFPFDQIYVCRDILTTHFRDKAIYRLTSPESVRYKQAVVFGIRRTRQERQKLTDYYVEQARHKLWTLTRRYEEISPLPDVPDRIFSVPGSAPTKLEHRGLPLDLIEDLLVHSPASLEVRRITHADKADPIGWPLTPLHKGHVGLLCTSGLLNGVFGEGDDRHVAYWEAVKVTDRLEEENEEGATVIREKERFSQRLTLLYRDGRFALLSERGGNKEKDRGERTPSNGQADICAPDKE